MKTIDKLKSFIDTFIFTHVYLDKPKIIWFLLSAGAIIYNIIFQAPLVSTPSLIFIISVFFLVFSSYSFMKDLFSTKSLYIERDPMLEDIIENMVPSSEEQRSGYYTYKNESRYGETFIYSKAVNKTLRNDETDYFVENDLKMQKVLFDHLRNNIDFFHQLIRRKWLLSFRRSEKFVNDEKIGLSSSLLLDQARLNIYKTDKDVSGLSSPADIGLGLEEGENISIEGP